MVHKKISLLFIFVSAENCLYMKEYKILIFFPIRHSITASNLVSTANAADSCFSDGCRVLSSSVGL